MTRKGFTRRQAIRSAAATLWLPFLPLLPRGARAAEIQAPRRMLDWFMPNGFIAQHVTPTTFGEGYELGEVLAPFAPIQDRVSVISGLKNYAADSGLYSTHESCTASLLSDHEIRNVTSGPLSAGVSVDQIAAAHIGHETPFPSMQISMAEPWVQFGNYDIYYGNISWASPSTPLPGINTPDVLFERMFGGFDDAATEQEIARRDRLRTSVLDAVLERTAGLEKRLDAADRAKLDQYTTGVRELELRIGALQELECVEPDEPAVDLAFEARADAFVQLLAVALRCDYTRIITFMLGPSTAETTYSHLGHTTNHHDLSHDWPYYQSGLTQFNEIQSWHAQKVADLCTALAETPAGDSDLLANTMVAFVSEFSQPNLHNANAVPMILAGGEAAGTLQGVHRQHLDTPHSNVLRSMLEFVGGDPEGFGQNSTGTMDLTVL